MKALRNSLIILAIGLLAATPSAGQNEVMPIGFFAPEFSEGHTIYLFNLEETKTKISGLEKPIDSLTFKKLGYNMVIDYAPSWFEPVFNKLDYGIFYIGVKRLGSEYVEVIANEETGKTIYMKRHAGEFVSWEEFLLSMHSVEFDTEGQKVYDHWMVKSAGRVYDRNTFFRPKYMEGDWMEVEILDNDFRATGKTGWIRWRKDGKLLIRYNLLS
ncbi:hypothetical protein [Luteirhabdus pelagi]|uniref:hypothetical protein n=1 Tax=Luteirhabdus pelagi TaxID=2792783 RepID=UPI00193AB698|nr:hypothetical protein [Luteirhabdus pelagi]